MGPCAAMSHVAYVAQVWDSHGERTEAYGPRGTLWSRSSSYPLRGCRIGTGGPSWGQPVSQAAFTWPSAGWTSAHMRLGLDCTPPDGDTEDPPPSPAQTM